MSRSIQVQSSQGLIDALRSQIARLEGARRQATDDGLVPSGCGPLDRLLPERGFRWGTLVEWLTAGEGTGAETMAFRTARSACHEGGALVVLNSAREFYPSAAARLGIELERVIVVQASHQADDLWALDQSLRCPAVAAVVAWPQELDGHTFRRLQLAAEQGGGLGLLMRPESVRQEPSWADVRLLVEPLPATAPDAGRRLRIQLLRSRGGKSGGSVELELDHETPAVYPAPGLARPANRRQAARA